ncbi:hypothetical protein NDU88_004223 [Pleurodeles waltl]|uniref:Uncharacterized protein n=1 Tax=Pleurodeles waltl TaxID=8319 RepID=A0AAV7QEA2_PLEWA|nr:hypothetical protein NDU88_004223 [Pleurodeles waltl]
MSREAERNMDATVEICAWSVQANQVMLDVWMEVEIGGRREPFESRDSVSPSPTPGLLQEDPRGTQERHGSPGSSPQVQMARKQKEDVEKQKEDAEKQKEDTEMKETTQQQRQEEEDTERKEKEIPLNQGWGDAKVETGG